MKEEDKNKYELIAEEIDTGNTQKALWTKAFSDAEGDESRTKALYIKYRFEEISNEKQEYHEDGLDNEDSNLSKSERFCNNCSEPDPKFKFWVDGDFRLFCSEKCYESSLKRKSKSVKYLTEQKEYSGNKIKNIEEASPMKNKSFGETSSPINSPQDEAMTTSEAVKDGNQYFLDYQNKISSQKRINKYVSDMKKQSDPKVTPKIDGFLAVVGFFLVIICIFFGLCSFMQFTSHDLQLLVFHGGLFYKRADLFYEYVEMYQWRLFGEFLLMLFLTFNFFMRSKDFLVLYFVGIPVNILVAYFFYYQLVLEVYSNANLELFLVINGFAHIPTIVYLTLFIYFLFSSKVKQTFVN